MHYKTTYGSGIYSPSVEGLDGIMAIHSPLGATYAQSPLLPADVGTPVIDMHVRMPDENAALNGCCDSAAQFNNEALNGFGAVQDAVSVLSFVDLLARA